MQTSEREMGREKKTGEGRELNNYLHNLYSSPDNIRISVIK
jgi:hypothetical protein